MINKNHLKPGEKKVFRMGKHFKTYHVLSYAAVTMVVYVFYTLYDMIFVTEGSLINGTQMFMIFAALEFILMVGIKKGGDWIKKNYYYFLDDKGVNIVLASKTTTYTWDKFEHVEMGFHSFIDLCPVQYKYEGKKLTFSQYLEDMFGMHLYICDRISDHVEIPDELIGQLYSFSKD